MLHAIVNTDRAGPSAGTMLDDSKFGTINNDSAVIMLNDC